MTTIWIVLEMLGALGAYRIVDGRVPPDAGAIERVEWLCPRARSHPWTRCFVTGLSTASCWVLRSESAGVVLVHAGGSVWWRFSAPDASSPLRSARWGRLLIITRGSPSTAPLRVSFGHPVAPPAGRLRAIRWETGPIADAHAVFVAPDAVWIAGGRIPAESWVEIASDATSPLYLPLDEIAAAPPSLPLYVPLSEARPIDGRVMSADDRPAGGSLVTVFRLIDPPPDARSAALRRRVLAGESIAGESGRFTLPALADADYEVVAWHAQMGRASQLIHGASREIVIRLRTNGVARGRVLAGGRPIEGVDVISVPDPRAFGAAADMTEVKGGDSKTGPDGRFTVMLAPSGGGELRIGGGEHPVARIPLPKSAVPLFDAGDIELGRAISLRVLLDRDPGCALRAAGPVGRTGLHVITATRTGAGSFQLSLPEPGLWEFTLDCRNDARSLQPSVVRIDPALSGTEVQLIVR